MSHHVFARVWCVDTEYQPTSGEPVRPICLVAHELKTSAIHRRWFWDASPGTPPWGPDDLVVCYSATAECGVFAALGWPQPSHLVDLWAEFRRQTNGQTMHSGFLQALAAHGIPMPVDDAVKKSWQRLCAKGSSQQITCNQSHILQYCEADVLPLCALYEAMATSLDLDTALFVGKYGIACAEIERRGMPVDAERLAILSERWDDVRAAAAEIATTRMRFKVYGGELGTSFRYKRFQEYLHRVSLLDRWPRTASGRLATDDRTLKTQAARHPDLEPLRQARRTMSMRHPSRILVGRDGRCRTAVRPFTSITGRNQPRSETPLAFSAWMRALITPPPGRALVMLDYSQQEFGLAAVLSGDSKMLAAYASGDAYLAFAIQCGALPAGADRGQPAVDAVRNIYKTASVAIMYGVSVQGLAEILGIEESRAAAIMLRHKRTYRRFWEWSDEIAATAAFEGALETPLGWQVDTLDMGDRSVRNWLIQSTAGDILRTVAVRARVENIETVALVHDAILIEVSAPDLGVVMGRAKSIMIAAGQGVAGITLRVDAQVVRSGERYFKDDKAKAWWGAIWKRLGWAP